MRISLLPALATAAVVGALGLAGCGESGSTGPAPGGSTHSTRAVTIKSFAFDPPALTVPVGTTVMWTNRDPVIHTATSVAGAAASFDSGNLDKGAMFSHTFDRAGAYPYHCAIHANMTATLTVR